MEVNQIITPTLSWHSIFELESQSDSRQQTLSPIFVKHRAREILETTLMSTNENYSIADIVPGPLTGSTLQCLCL